MFSDELKLNVTKKNNVFNAFEKTSRTSRMLQWNLISNIELIDKSDMVNLSRKGFFRECPQQWGITRSAKAKDNIIINAKRRVV